MIAWLEPEHHTIDGQAAPILRAAVSSNMLCGRSSDPEIRVRIGTVSNSAFQVPARSRRDAPAGDALEEILALLLRGDLRYPLPRLKVERDALRKYRGNIGGTCRRPS